MLDDEELFNEIDKHSYNGELYRATKQSEIEHKKKLDDEVSPELVQFVVVLTIITVCLLFVDYLGFFS